MGTLLPRHPSCSDSRATSRSRGFITSRDFGGPVLATRDGGRFRAFANTCRHRGVVLEDRERGRLNASSAPSMRGRIRTRGSRRDPQARSLRGDRQGVPRTDRAREGLHGVCRARTRKVRSTKPRSSADCRMNSLPGISASSSMSGRTCTTCASTGSSRSIPSARPTTSTRFTRHPPRTLRQRPVLRHLRQNHRMILCLKSLDALRGQPEDAWPSRTAASRSTTSSPREVNVGATGVTLVRTYPDRENPGRSISRITFYSTRRRSARIPASLQRARIFGDVIRDEDYGRRRLAALGGSRAPGT